MSTPRPEARGFADSWLPGRRNPHVTWAESVPRGWVRFNLWGTGVARGVEDGPDQQADVALVDAGDGLAEADGCLVGEAGCQSEHSAFPARPRTGRTATRRTLVVTAQARPAENLTGDVDRC